MGVRPCWVIGCVGGHDKWMHPIHNCEVPIEPWLAMEKARNGQKVRGEVMMPLPSGWTCKCGKHWKRTRYDGWGLS